MELFADNHTIPWIINHSTKNQEATLGPVSTKSKGCLKKTATFFMIDWNCYCHLNSILSIERNSNIFIWLQVMLLMTNYSYEVIF